MWMVAMSSDTRRWIPRASSSGPHISLSFSASSTARISSASSSAFSLASAYGAERRSRRASFFELDFSIQ